MKPHSITLEIKKNFPAFSWGIINLLLLSLQRRRKADVLVGIILVRE